MIKFNKYDAYWVNVYRDDVHVGALAAYTDGTWYARSTDGHFAVAAGKDLKSAKAFAKVHFA